MNSLGPPDSHHVRAAQGWFELNNHMGTNEELEKIAPELRAHPDVRKMRVQIYFAAKQWEMANEVTTTLTKMVPDEWVGFCEHSLAPFKLKRN